jgi:hypothetical protein
MKTNQFLRHEILPMVIFEMQVEFVFTGIRPIAVKLQTGKFFLEKSDQYIYKFPAYIINHKVTIPQGCV